MSVLELIELSRKIEELEKENLALRQKLATAEGERVVMKDCCELKALLREGKVKIHHVSDDGEVQHWGTPGNPSFIHTFSTDDMGKEYLVVDHPNPINRNAYENRKIFFKPALAVSPEDTNECQKHTGGGSAL